MGNIINLIKGAFYGLCFYLWGRERMRRKEAESALKLQQAYAQIDADSKHYRSDGKSGLLKRLHNKANDQS